MNGPSSRSKPAASAIGATSAGSQVEVAGQHPGPRARDQRGAAPRASWSARHGRVEREVGRADRPPRAVHRHRRRATSTRRSPSPGEHDHLALDHLAAHDERVGLAARGTRAWRAPTPARRRARRPSCAPWSAKRVRQRRWSSSWKRVHVGGQAAQRRARPAEGGPADGIGHAVLEVRRHDPHQRSLALAGQTAAMTVASPSPAPVATTSPPTSSPTAPTSHARTPCGCSGTSTGTRVLDLGCGAGHNAIALARRAPR